MKIYTTKYAFFYFFQPREKPIKVYDAILFSNEMEILEIRLRELYEFVDKFIILESDHTFTGRHSGPNSRVIGLPKENVKN